MGCAGRPLNGCSGYRMHRVTRSALSPVAVVTGRTRPAGWGAGECPRGRAAGGRAAGASRGTSCHLRTGVLPAQRRGRRGPSGRGAGRDFTLSRRARNAGEVAAACHIPSTYSPGSYLSPTRGGGGAAATRRPLERRPVEAGLHGAGISLANPMTARRSRRPASS